MNRRDDTPARRNQDTDRLAAWNAIYDRYSKLITPGLLVVATWFFAHIWEPIQAFPALEAQSQSIAARMVIADAERGDLKETLKIVVRMQCLQLSAIDRAKIGLSCADIPVADESAVQRTLATPFNKGQR